MRQLITCHNCTRQLDAGERPAGEKLHCSCGAVLEVPIQQSHEAAVVRCSSCGAPREGEAPSCGFCGSSYTLAERDRHTICPSCAARISDQASYCHHCGTAIVAETVGSAETEHPCPSCDDSHHLRSRQLGNESVSVLECGHCAGLWVGNDTLKLLLKKARTRAESAVGPPPAPSDLPPIPTSGRLYRPCVVCGALMNRQNFARRSGVVIDRCKNHGIWFDDQELEAILHWVGSGGLEQAQQSGGGIATPPPALSATATPIAPKLIPDFHITDKPTFPVGGLISALADVAEVFFRLR